MAAMESTKCHNKELKLKKTIFRRIKTDIKTMLTVQQAVTLFISILLMAVILQVPTIVYYNNQPSLPTISYSIGIDFNSCSIQPDSAISLTDAAIENVQFCSEFPPLLTQNQAAYNICLTSALALLQSLQSINSVLNNKQCQNSAIPFFCNATQVLCSDQNRFVVGLEENCVQVRDYDCTSEWRAYEMFFNRTLPDCTSFAKDGNLTFSKAPTLVCPETFDLYCGSFCLPSCKNFFQLSTDAIIAANAIRIALIALGMLGGVFNLIVCILNRRKMLQFPQIFLVYNTLIFVFVLLFLLLPLTFDHSVFLCSESNVIEAFNNPTGYCQVQGFILHSGILCFGGFLLFHTTHLLFALAFPFKARNFMTEYSKIAHIVEVIVVFALGLLPGTVVLSTSKYQIDRFPPDTCYPSVELLFHTFILPVIIYATIGLAMLFTVFSILRRNHQLNRTSESTKRVTLSKLFCIGFSTPETKLFILFLYYILLFLVILTYLTVNTQAVDSTFENLRNYLKCSIAGYKPECDVYKENIKEITRPSYYLDLLTYMMACTINLSNLTYTLQIYDIKLFFKNLRK